MTYGSAFDIVVFMYVQYGIYDKLYRRLNTLAPSGHTPGIDS